MTTVVIDDEWFVAEVEEHRDRRVRDHLDVDGVIRSIAEPGHGDPRQTGRPRRDRYAPRRHAGPSRLRRSHAAMVRATDDTVRAIKWHHRTAGG
jgi:hypothetical protein